MTIRLWMVLFLSLFSTLAFAIDKTPTGFYYPTGTASFDSACGTWLGRDPANGGCYFDGYYHVGVDMMTRSIDANIYAIADGKIVGISNDPQSWGPGNCALVIRHNKQNGEEFIAVYGHLICSTVPMPGIEVIAGSSLGKTGVYLSLPNTHLHFSIHDDPYSTMAKSGWGMMPNSSWPDQNTFTDPVEFIRNNTPFSSGPPLRYCGQISATETLCWDTKDSADITCESGSNWTARNNENAWSYPADKSFCSLLGCYPRTTFSARFFTASTSDSCLWKEGGSDTAPTPPPATALPNLQVEEITVHAYPEGTNTRLVEETTLMNVGGYYQINVWPVSNGTDCQNGNFTGNPDFEVKTDLLYQIAQSVDDGAWKLLKRSETRCKYLVENDSKKEMIAFTVPPGSEGKRLYLKAKVDATDSISETDDNDNQSDIEWYPIRGDCNLTISSARLTGHRVSLMKGESYGFAANLFNQGPDACPRDTRLSYFFKKPGDADFRYADGDDTSSSKLLPNQSTEEWMTEDTLIADTVGTHEARVCADTNLANEETDEGDNCYVFFYDVLSPPPSNITVTDPPTGATWRCSSSSEYRYIRWSGVTYEQSPTVELWFSKDDGSSWKLIDPAVSNDGKYRWYMCKSSIGSDSSNGRVKVVAKAASGMSGRFFIDYARGCK